MDRAKTEPNIARAILRSRSARAAIRRRRRRNVAIAVCVSVALAGAGTFGFGGLAANDMVQAAVARAQNLAELLDQRSPGGRTEAQLTKTKHERALAKQRSAPRSLAHLQSPPVDAKDNLPGLIDLLSGPGPVAAVDTVLPNPQIAIGTPPSLVTIVSPPPGSGTPPPGSGTPPPGSGTPPIVTVPTPPQEVVPPSPLPEPGTWAMMLLGFALIGWRTRQARKASSQILAA